MTTFAPKHAVCLIDLSPISATVLSWARLFARHFPMSFEIFHAAWSGAPRKENVDRGEEQLLTTELRAALERLAGERLDGASYHVSVEEGHPMVLVLDRLERGVPDLIVLGSHGYDGLARSLMGSVAENVVRIAPCPMLIVKGDPLGTTQDSIRRVLCPVNLTDTSRDGAQLAALCASKMRAELELVQAVDDGDLDEAQLRLQKWAEASGVRAASTRILRGEPSEQVVSRLRQSPADLVVIGAEQKAFLEFTTLGRTTERVMRHASCSVLLLPRRA